MSVSNNIKITKILTVPSIKVAQNRLVKLAGAFFNDGLIIQIILTDVTLWSVVLSICLIIQDGILAN